MILQDKVKTFCYLGLMPFIFIPIISWVSPKTAFDYQLIFLFFSWSLMMGVFMTGTLWGMSLEQKKSIIPSVGIFSLLLMTLTLNNYEEIKLSIYIIFLLLFVYEAIYRLEKKLIFDLKWYRELRFHLTFSIRICHLLMIAFIFTYQ